jgi:hypothetical protein
VAGARATGPRAGNLCNTEVSQEYQRTYRMRRLSCSRGGSAEVIRTLGREPREQGGCQTRAGDQQGRTDCMKLAVVSRQSSLSWIKPLLKS